MYKVSNFFKNPNVTIVSQKGPFTVVEYNRDVSVTGETAQVNFFMGEMGVRKRQLACNLLLAPCTLQAGAMQWSAGTVECTTGVKGAKDLLSKMVGAKVTGESAIKPEYKGSGLVVTEPTYKHLILQDLSHWGGSVVLEDGLFLACESSLRLRIVARSNISSAVAGGEGLFNLSLSGQGIFCIESKCPASELITVDLDHDELKIDGSYAVMWSTGLEFTVERAGKTLIGSAASGEGLVNVYRGSGKVMLRPV